MNISKTATEKDGLFTIPRKAIEPQGVIGRLQAEQMVQKSRRDIEIINGILNTHSGSLTGDAWDTLFKELELLGLTEKITHWFPNGNANVSVIEWLGILSVKTRVAHFGIVARLFRVLLLQWEARRRGDWDDVVRMSHKLFEIGKEYTASNYETMIVAGAARVSNPDNVERQEAADMDRQTIRCEALSTLEAIGDSHQILRSLARIIDKKNIVDVGFETIRKHLGKPSIIKEFRESKN